MKTHVRVGRGLLVLALVVGMLVSVIGTTPVGAAPKAEDRAPLAAITLNGVYTQDFDTLANTGTSSVTPNGWEFLETGANANTTYAAGIGSDTAGNTYSFGAASTTERAFGGLLSSNLIPTIGVQFQNAMGGTITSLAVQYNCEQWRLGTLSRTDRLDFQYSTDATSLTTGTWTNVDTLDCSSFTTGPTIGALNGNTNRSLVSATVSGLTITSNAVFWLRWMDFNASGADDGLSVDDFSVTPAITVVDLPPTVTSTTPATGASGVAFNANIDVTFSEPVTVTGAWYAISCTTSGSHSAIVSGGPSTFTLNPGTNFASNETCTVTIYKSQVADQDGTADNMDSDYVWSFTTADTGACLNTATKVHDVQGNGITSPMTGSGATIQGVVVGDYQDVTTGLGGFFIQEEDLDADADPATSEGIFVYAPGSAAVDAGDVVRVTGTVTEFGTAPQTLTELDTITNLLVCSSGAAITPSTVVLPAATATELERYEGMRVTIPQALTATEHYTLGRYGEVLLAAGGRLFQFTHNNAPSVPGNAAYLANLPLRTITLDDGNGQQNRDPILHPAPGLSAANTLRIDDTVTGLTGVLDQRFDLYRIQPVAPVSFTPANSRPETPVAVGGNVRVVAFNMLNYFSTIDPNTGASGYICGPLGNQECRGADSAAEFTRQRDKIINAIVGLDADVVGLMEMENHATDAAVQNLISGLNAVAGPGVYASVNTGPLGGDAIKVAMIYKPGKVTPIGAFATKSTGAFAARNRQPLVQTFEDNIWGERFTVVVNHLKSKGSDCDNGAVNDPDNVFPNDPDTGDGQGNCNLTRTIAANDLTTWLATDPTNSADPDFLIVGDLNAYAQEDPITAIEGASYTNLLESTLGASAYSYVFDGQSGYLDHALAKTSLASQMAGIAEWHINADEPISLDYNVEFKSVGQQASLYAADQYRASDHDPVLVGLGLYPDQSDLASSYGLAWHTGQGALRLGLLWTGEDTSTPGGDTGDDGVTIDTSDWRRGGTTAATVVVTRLSGSGNAWLAGWADWNNNGSFADPGELIVNGSVTVGSNTFSNIPIPVDAVVGVPVNMRFRLYDSLTEPAALAPLAVSPSGRGNGGEVEDQSIQSIPLAVLLAGFDATAQGDAILVIWDTVSELNNQGFNLYRGGSPTAPETLLGNIPSLAPGSGAGASYQWLDEGLAAGQTFYYWLEAVDLSGATTLHGPVSATTQSPTAVTLSGLEAGSRPGISAGWIGVVLFFVIGLASVVLTAERRQRRVR